MPSFVFWINAPEMGMSPIAFFDYIEGIIERRSTFTMEEFAGSVNKFLEFNEYKVLEGYGTISRKRA